VRGEPDRALDYHDKCTMATSAAVRTVVELPERRVGIGGGVGRITGTLALVSHGGMALGTCLYSATGTGRRSCIQPSALHRWGPAAR